MGVNWIDTVILPPAPMNSGFEPSLTVLFHLPIRQDDTCDATNGFLSLFRRPPPLSNLPDLSNKFVLHLRAVLPNITPTAKVALDLSRLVAYRPPF